MSLRLKPASPLLIIALLLTVACGDDGDANGGASANSQGNNANNAGNNAANNAGNNANNANNAGNNSADLGNPDPSLGHWVLIDLIHSRKQRPSLKLERGNFFYQGMHGYHRIFKHLAENGYPHHEIWEGELTYELIKPYPVLFINLTSQDRPRFTDAEVAAIIRYTEEGGGLFAISDHTNVYYSADYINPFLIPMGFEITYYGALDRGPEHALGSAWLKIRSFTEHPVTEGVRLASFQTGGNIVSEHGVAHTSPLSWGDFWDNSDPEGNIGFYGNGVKDPDEPSGPLDIVAAGPYGAGRVAIVGDQNIFGDEWLFMGHNFELATNIFEWLARAEDETPPLRERLDPSLIRVGLDLDHSAWNIGTNACYGYFPFHINFNRSPEIVARGLERITGEEDILIFTDIQTPLSEAELGQVRDHLSSGRTVIALAEVVRGQDAAWRMIEALVPEFSVEGAGGTIPIAQLPTTDANIATHIGEDEFPISSPVLDYEGLRMAGHTFAAGQVCPNDIEQSEPYLRVVSTTSGEPFIQAEVEGETVDLARTFEVEGGRLIVFLQAGFWRNETLGWERQEPSPNNADAHAAQHILIDWLIEQARAAR